tara:strand:- start:441 stop:767 length:327 start_codon:yes stop_codon:yes gene_type:complete
MFKIATHLDLFRAVLTIAKRDLNLQNLKSSIVSDDVFSLSAGSDYLIFRVVEKDRDYRTADITEVKPVKVNVDITLDNGFAVVVLKFNAQSRTFICSEFNYSFNFQGK